MICDNRRGQTGPWETESAHHHSVRQILVSVFHRTLALRKFVAHTKLKPSEELMLLALRILLEPSQYPAQLAALPNDGVHDR